MEFSTEVVMDFLDRFGFPATIVLILLAVVIKINKNATQVITSLNDTLLVFATSFADMSSELRKQGEKFNDAERLINEHGETTSSSSGELKTMLNTVREELQEHRNRTEVRVREVHKQLIKGG